jgi:cytosine/uracil/thiamine/allantoin permease
VINSISFSLLQIFKVVLILVTAWNIFVSAGSPIDIMSGYTIWLAPISAILIVDYWIAYK